MGQKQCFCAQKYPEESYEETYFHKSTELQTRMRFSSTLSTQDTVTFHRVFDPKLKKDRMVPGL